MNIDRDTSASVPPEGSQDDIAKAAASVARVLGHGLRMQILRRLTPFGGSGLSAGVLSTQLKVVPSSLSFHLQQMTGAGVLIARHDGRTVFYSVDYDRVAALCDFLSGLIGNTYGFV
jgi:DNA-binding transcriptional ArsR family regulator